MTSTLSTDFHAHQDALKRMKPTIDKNGQWVFAPPPPQDEAWLRKQPLPEHIAGKKEQAA